MGELDRAYTSVIVRREGEVCYLQLHRPDAENAINDAMLAECGAVLRDCTAWAKLVVLEGLPHLFCMGADLQDAAKSRPDRSAAARSADALYGVWLQLKRGPFISIAHVRGKVTAGGVGFVAACDLVLCADDATFALPELLFGLMPACVLPFLIDRVGKARAHAMTVMTQPAASHQALAWGLADASTANSGNLLRQHLLRLRLLSPDAIRRYKHYLAGIDGAVEAARAQAVAANAELFSDPAMHDKLARYAATGQFPWEVV
ncbi:enoyl-CoA hydratase [Duganella sp. Leaf126]|uniref:enoyl-CoA hydratase/isomerase n=1 Tax=Duganella sp. Leaf126 TaxID=1736266 RepID=UPI0006F803B9|nr:enoyl-CoA hydratase/isomerase [Duganella sp. Leaf126]KQQ40263.1 enoyl-CoA hydratase [Duganella sp. Leaf126]